MICEYIISIATCVWTFIGWDGVTAIATTTLVVVGSWQILGIRAEAKKERTLAVCNRYDSDLLLDRCARELFIAKMNGDLAKSPSSYIFDVNCILNYLDSVAIGIEQDVYVEKMARDHLQQILTTYAHDYLTSDAAKAFGITAEDFSSLRVLNARWTS